MFTGTYNLVLTGGVQLVYSKVSEVRVRPQSRHTRLRVRNRGEPYENGLPLLIPTSVRGEE